MVNLVDLNCGICPGKLDVTTNPQRAVKAAQLHAGRKAQKGVSARVLTRLRALEQKHMGARRAQRPQYPYCGEVICQ